MGTLEKTMAVQQGLGLRAVVRETLRTYELAHAAQIDALRQIKLDGQTIRETVDRNHENAIQRLRAARTSDEREQQARRERIGDLSKLTKDVADAARAVLERLSLNHLAGAPIGVDALSADVKAKPSIAQEFAEAHLALRDLRSALYRAAAGNLAAGRFDEARRLLDPLLKDADEPLARNAADLRRDIDLAESDAALSRNDLMEHVGGLINILRHYPGDHVAVDRVEQLIRGLLDSHPDLAWEVAIILSWLDPGTPTLRTLAKSIRTRKELSQLLKPCWKAPLTVLEPSGSFAVAIDPTVRFVGYAAISHESSRSGDIKGKLDGGLFDAASGRPIRQLQELGHCCTDIGAGFLTDPPRFVLWSDWSPTGDFVLNLRDGTLGKWDGRGTKRSATNQTRISIASDLFAALGTSARSLSAWAVSSDASSAAAIINSDQLLFFDIDLQPQLRALLLSPGETER